MKTATKEDRQSEIEAASSGLADPAEWFTEMLNGGTNSKSGATVTTATVLGLPAVWSPVQRISGHIGQLPIEIRKHRGPESSVIDRRHPAYRLLNKAPNDLQTPMLFKETLMVHALVNGNGRAWIERDGVGRPIHLLLLPATAVTRMWDGEKYHEFYLDRHYFPDNIPGRDDRAWMNPQYGQSDGQGRYYRIHDSDVFHIPGLSYNGLWGIDLVSFLKDVFGNDKSGQDTAAFNFRNNGRPSLLLEAPDGQLRKAKEATEFLTHFRKDHTGIDNAGKVGLIRAGMKAHVLPMSASDTQFLESRNFSREDIAMIFGTEALLGSSAVYKNLTERQAAYTQNALGRWIERWEQETEKKLFSFLEFKNDTHFAQINTTEILRGDMNSWADYTGKLRAQGALSGNDVRVMHNMNPVPGLDDYQNPAIAPSSESESDESQTDDNETEEATESDND